MMGKYGVISADSHIDMTFLDPETFVSRVPASLRGVVPRVVVTAEGVEEWVAGANGEYRCGRRATLDSARRTDVAVPRELARRAVGYSSEQCRPAIPALRIEDQEVDGVDAEVIYGVIGISTSITDLDLQAVTLAAYNEFVAEFNRAEPGRFYGLGCVAGSSAEAVVGEIEHVSELGLPGVELSPASLAKPIWHSSWGPVWEAAAVRGLPVSMHIRGGDSTRTVSRYPRAGEEHSDASLAAYLSVVTLQADETLASVVFSGALDRHPDLRVVFSECGIGWIPFLLERMDQQWEDNYPRFKELTLTKPSDAFRRQCYATFERDSVGVMLAAEYCPDSFMWGSDYPHQQGTWPESREAIRRYLQGADPEMRQKIVHDNVAKLYHMD